MNHETHEILFSCVSWFRILMNYPDSANSVNAKRKDPADLRLGLCYLKDRSLGGQIVNQLGNDFVRQHEGGGFAFGGWIERSLITP